MCGVHPESQVEHLPVISVDPDTPLVTAARPILRRMAEALEDTPLAVLLAGQEGLVLDVVAPYGHGLLADLARTRIGRQCSEEAVGTNSIGTALELGRGVRVRGDEHYLESLRSLDCLGTPIRHPISGRIEGVLSLCGGRSHLNDALGPFLSYAARDIRERLLQKAPKRHLQLLDAFHLASRGDRRVVVLGSDLVLASPSAIADLQPADYLRLRELGIELGSRESSRTGVVELASGARLTATVRRCGGPRGGGLIVELENADVRPLSWVPRGRNVGGYARESWARELVQARQARHRTVVSGEPGTGKTTTLAELADGARLVSLHCHEATASPSRWRTRLARALNEAKQVDDRAAPPLVAIEGIEALPAAVALSAAELLGQSSAWIAMTCAPIDQLAGEHATLIASCDTHLSLSPLRARTSEIPALLREITRAVAESAGVKPLRWTPAAIAALSAHSWPGNLHEMRAVVQHAVRVAVDGCGTVDVLPPLIQRGTGRALTPIERSEREAILSTLRACDGNKVHAATQLGISRTTLYKRIRSLGISPLDLGSGRSGSPGRLGQTRFAESFQDGQGGEQDTDLGRG
jgi:transcriptional regulator of acetoin/glycerol metabolism